MISDLVEIVPELLRIDGRSVAKDSHCGFSFNEAVSSEWAEFAYWYAVASDNKRLSFVELTHDVAAAVAKLALGNGLTHVVTVARRATS